MNPYISVVTPFTVAGRTLRKNWSEVRSHADIPAFCFGEEDELDGLLKNLHILFQKSDAIKHCEVGMCYDIDSENGEFTYLMGRGIFDAEDLSLVQPDMVTVEISGLYAVFSTPPVPIMQSERYQQVIKETWNAILTEWLPNSEFEYDETRRDYEFYDYRDHGLFFENQRQMDICIPIRQQKDAREKSLERSEFLWQEKAKQDAKKKL